MKKLLLALVALLLLPAAAAHATNCASYPFTLTNGQTADANQVMSNFTSVLNCTNTSLAHSGANSDITSLSGLSTPLSTAQGGTGNSSGTATPSGAAAGVLSGTYPNPGMATGAAVTNIGYTPLNKAGDTMTGAFTTKASAAGAANFNIPPGVAPTTPTNGDFWATSSGIFARVNGSTQQLASTAGSVASFNTRTGAVTLTSGDVTTALAFTPANINGDTFTGTVTFATGSTSLAPFKFVTGTNLTTPVSGAAEWDGTSLFLTQSAGPTRKTVAYIDSALSGNTTGSAAKWTTARTEALGGDLSGSQSVDGSAGWTLTATIGAGAVTGSKIASATVANSNLSNMAANTFKCNNTGGSAAPIDCTIAQTATALTGTAANTLAAGNDSRFVGPTQNSQSVNYTLVLSDGGNQIYHPSSDTTARTWTIPANGSVAYQTVTKIELVNDCSAGAITLNITTDTMVWFPSGTTGSRTIAACGMATLTKVSSTRWIITGTGIS